MSKTSTPMEHQSIHKFAPAQEPGEDAIREYAYHLYQQGNYAPGHDVANWLEATACLKANIPTHHTHCRLHWHLNGHDTVKLSSISIS
jgi:hypothetical protein